MRARVEKLDVLGWNKYNVDVSEDTKRGLYSKASPWLNSIDDHWISNTDLEQVNINLMKTVDHVSTYCPL